MRKLICSILLLVLSTNALADCDFSTGITAGPNHTHIFSEECYLKVGQLVQDNAVKTQQIADLNAAISLKNLAISNSDARVALWQKSSDDNLDRLNRLQSDQKHDDYISFGLGILLTIGAAYAVHAATH